MNPFVKAAALTVIILMLTLVLVWQIDSMRQNDLQKNISDLEFEMQTSQLLSRYGSAMAQESRCDFLNYTESMQEKKAFSTAYSIQEYERSHLVGSEYENLKRSYFASLMDLYITTFENKKNCPDLGQVPVAFFYTQADCPACQVQGQVLSSVAQKCNNVQIFAFASDSQYPFLNLLVQRYNVSSTPSLVINDSQKIGGVTSEGELISQLKKAGAVCG
ncbi:MAG: thioredoxin family protein [Candidatus Micrarchaeota archaeon]